jgi:hypothetical protein
MQNAKNKKTKKQNNIVNLSHWHCNIQSHFNPMFSHHFERIVKTLSKHHKICATFLWTIVAMHNVGNPN